MPNWHGAWKRGADPDKKTLPVGHALAKVTMNTDAWNHVGLARSLLIKGVMRALPLACSALTLALSGSALAQNALVTLNGTTQPASGSFTNNFYRNSCDGDAGAAFTTFSLGWPLAVGGTDQLFWSNDSNCANDADGGANGIPFKVVTTTTGSSNYAPIISSVLLGSILNNTINQCDTGASGIAYICVVQTVPVSSGFTVTDQQLTWFMSFNYNMNPPPAPSGDCNGPCASPGDSSVLTTWSYDNTSISADHFNVYYQVDPAAQPDVNNNCVPTLTLGLSGPGLYDGLDGGDAGSNAPGVCNGCVQNSDCGGNNLCIFDQSSTPYCGLNCGAGAQVCPTDFSCVQDTSVDGSTSGLVCEPPLDLCITEVPDAGTPPVDAGPGTILPGLCGSCAQSSDCGGNNLCVADQGGNAYCGTDCYQDAGICGAGFTCQVESAINSGVTGYVCVPPGDLCYPPSTLCGTCTFNSDCGGANLCIPSDGGNYCGTDCSDAGQLDCPAGTYCASVMNVAGQTGLQCALPAGESCYNPGGSSLDDAGVDAGQSDDGGSGLFDGGLPSFGSGWGVVVANGQYITSLRINNLTNGVCYDFVVQSVAVDGTVGYPSSLVGAAPFASQDWWRLYKSQGGQDNGGWHCQSGGGGMTLASLALVLLFGRFIARKRPVASGGDGD
jgi:hypothetical protein